MDPGGDTAPIRQPVHEPIQFRSEPPPAVQNPVLVWVLRGLGLVAVAVISGLVWWYINDDAPTATSPNDNAAPPASGRFEFTPLESVKDPRRDSSCTEHAYGDVKTFFQATPCRQLTRALYTTTAPDGRKVYTNVAVVQMANAGEAATLRELADKDGTGNVTDLVKAGAAKIPSLDSLAGAGYTAVQHDRNVIIVESAFDPAAKLGDKKADKAVLDSVCTDAVRLGDEISGPGGS